MTERPTTWTARCFWPRAAAGGRARTRWSAPWSSSPDGVIVGQGFHERAGEPHAEVQALGMAGERGARGDAVLHARAVLPSGPHRPVRTAHRRSRHRARRRGDDRSESRSSMAAASATSARTAWTSRSASGESAAVRLNQPFFTLTREGRPFVILKAATSLDGCIARAPGKRTELTSAAANRHAHAVRAEIDAIGVGVGTILADDPLLTARGVYREGPLVRVIFDRRLRTPPSARVLSTRDAGPVMIVTEAGAAARAEARKRARGPRRGDRSRARRLVRGGAGAARRAAGRIAPARGRRGAARERVG